MPDGSMSRNSWRLVLVRLLEAAARYLPFLVFFLSVRERVDGWLGVALEVLFWYYTLTRPYAVLIDWLSVRFRADDDGLVYRSGLVSTQEVTLEWQDLVSFQVSRPTVLRALGCASVTFGVGGGQRRELVLHAVNDATASRLSALASAGGAADRATAPEHGAARQPMSPDASSVLYRTAWRDHAVMSVTYGQFILVIPLILSAYLQLTEWAQLASVPVPPWLSSTGMDTSPWGLGRAVAGVLVVSLGLGVVLSWLRYRRFTARVVDGAIEVSGGWLSEESRRLPAGSVQGVRIDQNLAMRALGVARLSVVSRQGTTRIGSNVVLPVAPLSRVVQLLDEAFPQYAWSGRTPHRPWGSWECVGLAAAIGLVTGVSLWVGTQRWGLVALVVCLTLVAGNAMWVALESSTGTRLVLRRGILWRSVYVVRAEDVHVMRFHQGLVARTTRRASLSLHFLDRGHRAVHGLVLAEDSVSQVRQVLNGAETRKPDSCGVLRSATEAEPPGRSVPAGRARVAESLR
jgi:putative membrane protein